MSRDRFHWTDALLLLALFLSAVAVISNMLD